MKEEREDTGKGERKDFGKIRKNLRWEIDPAASDMINRLWETVFPHLWTSLPTQQFPL